jgi:hypothetical protein
MEYARFFSGYCGIVTAFDVEANFISKYESQNVGGEIHNELWIPSNELEEFNNNIVGTIKIVNVFFGENYTISKNADVENIINRFKTK